jgi:hypothetical protein
MPQLLSLAGTWSNMEEIAMTTFKHQLIGLVGEEF